MGIMNGLTFGGINSLDYGIYISGEAVFNAPDREVEMINIPGRNGDYVLDHGRFVNIEVSYPAGTFGDDQTDFREKLSDFRNAILSQVGYQRLTDTYHPDEYRLGVYVSGLEVDPVHYNTAGEFVLTFNCKPQRWLTSGETAVTVADGGTIDNPTLFEANPILELYGYGDISLNDEVITLNNVDIGDVVVRKGGFPSTSTSPYQRNSSFNINPEFLDIGDEFKFTCSMTTSFQKGSEYTNINCSVSSTTNATASCTSDALTRTITTNEITFNYGTSGTSTSEAIFLISYKYNGTPGTGTNTTTIIVDYDGDKGITVQWIPRGNEGVVGTFEARTAVYYDIIGNSTQSALGNPTYIDLDIGEAYKVSGTSVVTLNNAAIIPSDLPTLKPGTNTINYNNTFTQVDIVPRWWRV